MITRCNEGHWYDTNTNKTCPHCKQNSEKLSIRLDDFEEDDKTISITEIDASLGEELSTIIEASVSNAVKPMDAQEHPSAVEEWTAQEEDDKTVSFGFFGMNLEEPVTGWLVCMSGDEKGKDFRLHSGKNFIGRSASMDVMLIDDKTIAREKHCSVIYDPKGNSFYLASESGNVVSLNQELIKEPTKLTEGDEIIIGETVLRFVPFCKEDMRWEKE